MTDEVPARYRKVEIVSHLVVLEDGSAFGVHFEVLNLKSREEAASCRDAIEAFVVAGFEQGGKIIAVVEDKGTIN